jgi:hypothetical protein
MSSQQARGRPAKNEQEQGRDLRGCAVDDEAHEMCAAVGKLQNALALRAALS